ncbi:O-antigen ligase family protein [Butyricimonas faecihominis]|uniref:O-antigen ligase family protein n=1 Tax=Butyricimonas faecihominis TaxID=1472416 RepID=UPI0032C07FEE
MILNVSKDKILSRFIIAYFLFSAINSVIKQLFYIPESIWNLVSFICGFIIIIFFIHSLKYIFKYSSFCLFYSYSIFFLVILWSCIINDVIYITDAIVWPLFICIPLGLAIYSLDNFNLFYNYVLNKSFLLAFVLILLVIFPQEDGKYNMFMSYSLLFPLLIHINEFCNTKKKYYLLILLLEIGIIIFFGSRGALLSITFFVMYKFFVKRTFKVSVIFGLGLLGIGIGYVNFATIGNWLLNKFETYNLYSRTLSLIFQNEGTSLSNRDIVWRYCNDMIFEKPILGWGYYGWKEQLVYAMAGGENGTGTYPHNIFIELCLDFGLVLGFLISSILILSFVRLFSFKDFLEKDLFVILFAIGFLPLLFSGSYSQSPTFYLYIYYFIRTYKSKKEIISR